MQPIKSLIKDAFMIVKMKTSNWINNIYTYFINLDNLRTIAEKINTIYNTSFLKFSFLKI